MTRANRNVDVLLPGVVGGTGGAAVLMLELATRLARRGLRPKIIVPDLQSTRPYVERCLAHDIPAEQCRWLLPREARVAGFMDAARFVRRYRAPVVHYHLSENVPNHLLLRAMDLLRPPRAFVTMHSPYENPEPGAPITHRWAAAAPRHFHRVICVSERARRLQIEYGVPESLVQRIANGVDTSKVAAGDAASARRALGVDGDAPIILVVARLAPQKRPLDAVKAFAAVAGEFSDAQLVFIGSGALEDEVRRAASAAGVGNRVHLMGQRSDVADWLAASTAWFLPTETEGFSVAVIEALAAGCAVVSTNCPGNDEVLQDGENALVVSVGDVPAMAEALRTLLSDTALRARLSAAGRRTAEAYTLERMVDAHVDCYQTGRTSLPLEMDVADGSVRVGPEARKPLRKPECHTQ